MEHILKAVQYGAFRAGWATPCKEATIWFKKARSIEELMSDPEGIDYCRWAAQVLLRDESLLDILTRHTNAGVRAAVLRNPFYKVPT